MQAMHPPAGVSADGAVTLQALNCSGNEPNIQACSSPITVQRSCSNQMALNLECAGMCCYLANMYKDKFVM